MRSLYAAGVLLCACGTGPDDELFLATYGTIYDPAQWIGGVLCDRLVSHVLVGFNELGDFDLSINVTDDCTRAGGGFSFFEVLRLGKATRRGSVMTFVPEDAPDEVFTGVLEGEYIRLTLPPGVGDLRTNEVELLVGPRSRD